ncbi:MAG: hypothetical protein DWP92_07435 [Armatimonadetes bacterium]|nr:MAG: hypothetical protein DWP92_07435 [Armatimonadota bacterium]
MQPSSSKPEPRNQDHRDRRESGAVLILMAGMIAVLLGMTAFAVDFGWLYWNGTKIQHGADAAALAGVIYEPDATVLAKQNALEVAAVNGYAHDPVSGNTIVTPLDYTDLATHPGTVSNANQLRVTVSHAVPTFFMKVFGFDTVTIEKTSVAEYVLPLAMGSDEPYFGQDPTAPNASNFWANIHGYYTGRTMGDRFASQCVDGGSTSSCTPNPEARSTASAGTNNGMADLTGGYLYGIEVPAGGSDLKVEILDGPFYRGGSDYVLVGDNPQGSGPGPTTIFMLYAPDPTPLNTTDGNELLCKVEYAPRDAYMPTATSSTDWATVDAYLKGQVIAGTPYVADAVHNGITSSKTYGELGDLWDQMCGSTVFNRGDGIYPLRVVVEHPGSDDERGLNRFSMRASTNGTPPRFFGLGDMAIYANFAGNTATFNLAEVPAVHAGKNLVIELWDPDSGNNGVEVKLPDGSTPQCSWTSTDGRFGPGAAPGDLGACDLNYSTSFNNEHMQIRIKIADDYSCTSACWWTLTVDYPGGANDTTTWSARVEGNPVKLVE